MSDDSTGYVFVTNGNETEPSSGAEPAENEGENGRVRSWRKRGYGTRRDTPVMRRFGSSDGYQTVQLSYFGKVKTRLVSRLVLLAFVGPPRGKRNQAAHLNGDKADNRLVNLKWCTRSENEAHKKIHAAGGVVTN